MIEVPKVCGPDHVRDDPVKQKALPNGLKIRNGKDGKGKVDSSEDHIFLLPAWVRHMGVD